MASDKVRVPIKVVTPSPSDYRRPEVRGGARKVFDEVDDRTRATLDTQLEEIGDRFSDSFRKHPKVPAVARVYLKAQALAKSHRPTDLLNHHTCPIIGGGDIGELYVSVRPSGLRSLRSKVKETQTQTGVANISAIERFEPYDSTEALRGRAADDLVAATKRSGKPLKVCLFSHRDAAADDAVQSAFVDTVRELGLTGEGIPYTKDLTVHSLLGAGRADVLALSRFVGTQSVGTFPVFRAVRTAAKVLRDLKVTDFPGPNPNLEYPVVGLIDSGIDPKNVLLRRWVVATENFLPSGVPLDFAHGTFVAGLLVHGRLLNGNNACFPKAPVKIIDVRAVQGGAGIDENDLVYILQEVIPKHPEARVWNVSLATEEPCVDGTFSELAATVDELQTEHNCTIVFPTGNYTGAPRPWPATQLGEADRLCPPADSVRALTVGSLAHIDSSVSRVRFNEPSPFSRRGPGPAFLPKPELSHYGGNTDRNGSHAQLGVMSVGVGGKIAEQVGTSFAAPSVAALLANVHGAVQQPMTTALGKALLIHSAVLASSGIDAQNLRYRGFGVPGDATEILFCTPWAATLLFEFELDQGIEFEKSPFPIPKCLRTPEGTVRGDFTMTLAYDPPLDLHSGAEYCRVNVDASFGTYDPDRDGKPQHRGLLPPQPRDSSKLQEKYLVEHGFKWSPLKVYKKSFPRGVAGNTWRLAVHRSSRANHFNSPPQSAAIVLTIADPNHEAPVYDEIVRAMAQSGWLTADLQVKAQSRYRIR